jgi:hypothetical protein
MPDFDIAADNLGDGLIVARVNTSPFNLIVSQRWRRFLPQFEVKVVLLNRPDCPDNLI